MIISNTQLTIIVKSMNTHVGIRLYFKQRNNNEKYHSNKTIQNGHIFYIIYMHLDNRDILNRNPGHQRRDIRILFQIPVSRIQRWFYYYTPVTNNTPSVFRFVVQQNDKKYKTKKQTNKQTKSYHNFFEWFSPKHITEYNIYFILALSHSL